MAKLCSSYGSSPSFSFLSDDFYGVELGGATDLGLNNTDLGLINPDPAELFEDVNLLNVWPTSSICSDIQRIKADSPTICGAMLENCVLTDFKPEIRNMDCMWSASTSLLGTSATSNFSDGGDSANAVPLAEIINNNNNNNSDINNKNSKQTPPATVVVVANNNNNRNNNSKNHSNNKNNSSNSSSCNNSQLQQQEFETINVKREIKEEPIDDYEQQLQQHSIPTSCKTTQQQQLQQQQQKHNENVAATTITSATCMQNIPAGASLLRKSQQQQQHKKQQQQQTTSATTIQIPKMYAGEFVRERDQLLTTTSAALNNNNNNNNKQMKKSNISSNCGYLYLRPDTPHSLDDDVTHYKNNNNNNNSNKSLSGEFFKHNVDLHACVMGSNNISLTADPTNFINHVSQELQDTSKTQIDMRYVSAGCSSLAEVAEVLEGMNDNGGIGGGGGGGGDCTATTASSSGVDCDTEDSAAEDEEAWNVGGDSTRCSSDSMLDAAEEEAAELNAYNVHQHQHHHNHSHQNAASPVPSQDSLLSGSSSCSNNYQQQPPYLMHSDHSYTRCKDGMDDLGPSLETPSDSGKLIFF